jgi:heptosyltransferase I
MNILIIKLSSFGDILHSLPVLMNIKTRLPESKVAWLISPKFAGLLKDHPLIDELIILPTKITQWPKLINRVKQENFDYVLDLQGLIKTGILAKLLGGKQVVGVSPARERLAEVFWTKKVFSTDVLDPNMHVIEKNLSILQALDLPKLEAPVRFGLPLNLSMPVATKKRFIACAPESRWKSKEWPRKSWIELINSLQKNEQVQVVLLGADPNFFGTELFGNQQVFNLMGKTPKLTDLKAIVSRAELLVGADSALIHLAAAYGVKTLGIYGPTVPTRTGPWQGESLWLDLECSPCHKRECPLTGRDHMRCLRGISSDTVLSKVNLLLENDF